MKKVINHDVFGEIIYDESFWTGKKTITLNGQVATKVDKNTYVTANGQTITIKGGFFTGSSATISGETVVLVPPFKWYEYVMALLPIVFVLIWGNVPALVEVFPIVGGAIGGMISAIFGLCDLLIFSKLKNVLVKIVVALAMFAACLLVCYLIALAILSAVA